MSAYLLSEQTFGILAKYAIDSGATQHNTCFPDRDKLDTTDKVVEVLVRANLKSLAARYGDEEDTEENELFIAETKDMARRDWHVPPLDIIKSCHCFDYQSCEFEGWHKSLAYRVSVEIVQSATRKLAGYESAQWGFTTENLPPVIKKMSGLPDGYKPKAGEVISLFS